MQITFVKEKSKFLSTFSILPNKKCILFFLYRFSLSLIFGSCFLVSYKIFFYNPYPEWQISQFPNLKPLLPLLSGILLITSIWTIFAAKPFRRYLVVILWLVFFLLALVDLNTWQPWVYIFLVWLSLVAFYGTRSGLYFLSSVYIFSALNKLNPDYFSQANQFFPWISIPSEFAGFLTSFFELSIGVGILSRTSTRYVAFWGIVLMHLYLCFVLFVGQSEDWIVYPWSILMILVVLNSLRPSQKTKVSTTEKCIFSTFIFLPVLGFFISWPSHLAFSFYSFNSDFGLIEMPESVVKKSLESSVRIIENKVDIQNAYIGIYKNTLFSHPLAFNYVLKNFCTFYPGYRFKLEIISRRYFYGKAESIVKFCVD